RIVSTFYLLPPRTVLAECLAETFFPGLPRTNGTGADLADVLGALTARHPDVYVVHREDLPDEEEPARALADGFGAEWGDEVVEVRIGSRPREWTSRRWSIGTLNDE